MTECDGHDGRDGRDGRDGVRRTRRSDVTGMTGMSGGRGKRASLSGKLQAWVHGPGAAHHLQYHLAITFKSHV